MACLYVDRKNASLRLDGAALLVNGSEGLLERIPLGMLDRIVMAAPGSVSTPALLAFAERGIGFTVLDGRSPDRSSSLAGIAGGNVRRRLRQAAEHLDEARRSAWARRIVLAKIRAQKRFLELHADDRADARHALRSAEGVLTRILAEVAAGDGAAASQCMGYEGGASAAYFRAFASLFAPALGFRGRNRRPPRDPVNAVLSLGYTLLHGVAVREIARSGLDPDIGFLHGTAYGRASLACDLVEPFRSLVDGAAYRMFRDRALRVEHFRMVGEGCLLGKAGRAVFYAGIDPVLERSARRLREVALAVVRGWSDGSEETVVLE